MTPGPSWVDILTAVSTFGLLVVAVVAGFIAYSQLDEFKNAERIKRTFALVDKYFVPVGTLPSPGEAAVTLLDLPADDASLMGKERAFYKAYATTLGKSLVILANYFDEAEDQYRRNYIDRAYFLSRHANLIKTAVSLFRKFERLTAVHYYDPALIQRLEHMLSDYKGSTPVVDFSVEVTPQLSSASEGAE